MLVQVSKGILVSVLICLVLKPFEISPGQPLKSSYKAVIHGVPSLLLLTC